MKTLRITNIKENYSLYKIEGDLKNINDFRKFMKHAETACLFPQRWKIHANLVNSPKRLRIWKIRILARIYKQLILPADCRRRSIRWRFPVIGNRG